MSETNKYTWPKIIAVALFLGIVVYFTTLNGCKADDADVLDAIRGAGLTDPELGDTDLLACAKNESSRHFSAKNQQGERVSGTVCCGLFGKGCTIRWGR